MKLVFSIKTFKEKELRPQAWAEMPLEPCLETSVPGPKRATPWCESTAVGTPGAAAAPQGRHPVCPLGPRGLLICTGWGRVGWALRAADMPSILSELLLLSQMCRAGRGLQEGKGRSPCPQLTGTSGLRQLEGAGSQHGKSHPWQGHAERPDGQGESGFRGSPWVFLNIYPQNQSLPALSYCAFHSSASKRN